MRQTPILLLLFLSAGCGADRSEISPPAGEAPAGRGDAPSATISTTVSPEYLAGSWCYEYYEAGGERAEQQITYTFHEDGSLRYQTTSTRPVDSQGSYVIEGNELEIRPTLLVAPRQLGEVTADSFVLGPGSTRFVFTRGACR